ncbi:hypothetical protein ACGFT2_06570 [Streptomyces sp. NPDC048514]|uniref:hypothetical protein n=1 Tax=Streptomyces sp. NPDC048514 TaxID=3365564 RepID=UPI003713DDAA
MGTMVSVRGWLQCDDGQLAQIKEIVEADDPERTCSGDWAFPARVHNGGLVIGLPDGDYHYLDAQLDHEVALECWSNALRATRPERPRLIHGSCLLPPQPGGRLARPTDEFAGG